MPYVENIKVGAGESWPIRDKEGRELIAEIWATIYPVGSIYMSVNRTSPDLLFGGTWERIQDTFLLAAGEVYEAGATGGEAEHKLTVEEMPSHDHYDGTNPDTVVGAVDGTISAIVFSNPTMEGARPTTATGGNQPHNNMPPYLAVYMWKRTA